MKRTSLLAFALLGWFVNCSAQSGDDPDDSAGGAGAASGGVAGDAGGARPNGARAGAPSGAGGEDSGVAGEGGGAGGPGGGPSVVDESAELYDPERVPHFEIELPLESKNALDVDPETYVTGTLRYGDEVVTNVGVRIKGEASLRPLSSKAAFKIKFDEFVPRQSFRGLRRLTLNNMAEDPSFMAERLAYQFFREVNLPAPRCNSALVSVNGAPYGVYANVETEDKTFLRRWFASDDGNLYEEGQVDFVPGAENDFELETNEAVNDRSDLVNLIAVLQAARPESFLADLGAALDVGHFLRFTAAEAAVNQWDMYAYTLYYPNNFRFYNDPTTGRFVFLPWGMDMSMKPFRDNGKPYIDVDALAHEWDIPEGPVTSGLMFQRCLTSPGCRAAYLDVVREIADLYEDAGLESAAERAYAQIQPLVRDDPRKEYSEEEFEAGYASLIATIRGRAAALRDSIDD